MAGRIDERKLNAEIARLRDLDLPVLRAVWRKHYGTTAPKTVRRKILILSIAWRIQADALGGLKPATRKYLRQVAEAARSGAVARPPPPSRRIKPGTKLIRVWQDKTHTVTALADGFEWQGKPVSLALSDRPDHDRHPLERAGVLRREDRAAPTPRKPATQSPPAGGRPMRERARIRTLRCAIYTRKSSEEGLEQDFNSLQAQREACEAYIASQKHEGWKALPAAYDDGAYSGGTMDRPALQQLLGALDHPL